MLSCLATLMVFVGGAVLYANSGQLIGVDRGWFDRLGFGVKAVPALWSYIVMYGLLTMWACFGVTPLLYNWALRLLARLVSRYMTTTQEFLNLCYEGYAFLHHYSVSYCVFVVLLGTMFSSSIPLGLPCIALSLFSRWAIDRVYLLYTYARTPPASAISRMHAWVILVICRTHANCVCYL